MADHILIFKWNDNNVLDTNEKISYQQIWIIFIRIWIDHYVRFACLHILLYNILQPLYNITVGSQMF